MIGHVFRRMRGPGLAGNIGAQGTSQAVNMLMQLVSVPILASNWGLEVYGIWLILFAFPQYLAMSDLGLIGAATNEVSMAAAQGRDDAALDLMQALQTLMTWIGLTITVLVMLVLAGPGAHWLDFAQAATGGQALWVMAAIVGWCVLGQHLAVALGGLRAGGHYPAAVNLMTAATLCETVALWIWVMAGGGLLGAALCYLIGHVVFLVLMRVTLARRVPWLAQWHWRPRYGALKGLLRPALGMILVPLCYALSMQGIVIAVGAALGAAAVPLFTSVRTLTRAAVQVTSVVNVASMPEYTVSHARGDRAKSEDIVALSIVFGLVVLVPAAIGLAFLGQWFVTVWTGGTIHPSIGVVLFLTAAMVLNGLWVPLSNLIMAINQPGRFSYFFAALALCEVLAAWFLARQFGVVGAAAAVAAFDAVMLAWIAYQARSIGMVHLAALRAAPARVLAMGRRLHRDGA